MEAYVKTYENPADIVSRVCSLSQIIDSSLWRNGPEWLQAEKSEWPKTNWNLTKDIILEERPANKTVMSTTRDVSMINRYSLLSRLL